MKNTLSLAVLLLLGAAVILGTGCKKCRNENPRARIVNNGTDKVSVQIMTSGGNTVKINNIMPGTVSEYASYEEGNVQFTIAFQVANDTTLTVPMDECWEYEIVVDAKGHTNVAGVFAAGDCTTVPYKQIVIAAGEGAKAALSAFDHLIRLPQAV